MDFLISAIVDSYSQQQAVMRTRVLLLLSCVLLVLGTACAPRQPAPEYRATATIKDLMDSVVDPNSDYLWDSVSTETSAKGTVDKAPKTDQDWAEERRHAIALLEATNLLQMPGRMVASPGAKTEHPGIEETPEAMQEAIDHDRASWIKYALGLYDATAIMMKSIDAKDAAGVLDAGDGLDKACEQCHQHYWYPHQFDYFKKNGVDKTGGDKTGSMRPKGPATKAP
jgi:cytochrome c556